MHVGEGKSKTGQREETDDLETNAPSEAESCYSAGTRFWLVRT